MAKIPTFTSQGELTTQTGSVQSNIKMGLDQNLASALSPITKKIVDYKDPRGQDLQIHPIVRPDENGYSARSRSRRPGRRPETQAASWDRSGTISPRHRLDGSQGHASPVKGALICRQVPRRRYFHHRKSAPSCPRSGKPKNQANQEMSP